MMEQDIEQLKNQVYQLTQKTNDIDSRMYQMQNTMIEFMQSINAQIMVLNQISQKIDGFNNRFGDMEIRIAYSDDNLKDVADLYSSLSGEIQELKTSIDALKFYAFNNNF